MHIDQGILDFFFIPLIENWFGDNEIIFQGEIIFYLAKSKGIKAFLHYRNIFTCFGKCC